MELRTLSTSSTRSASTPGQPTAPVQLSSPHPAGRAFPSTTGATPSSSSAVAPGPHASPPPPHVPNNAGDRRSTNNNAGPVHHLMDSSDTEFKLMKGGEPAAPATAKTPPVGSGGGGGNGGNNNNNNNNKGGARPRRRASILGGVEPEPFRVLSLMEPKAEYGDNTITTSKYTVLTFLPRNLFEQFRRTANFYFLFMSVLMTIGTYEKSIFDSPLSPYTTLGPLVGVLSITMVKEIIEDRKRHRSDNEVNSRKTVVLADSGAETETAWQDLRVGHIVKLFNRQEVPADMVLLQTSESQGMCYIETSNIDGETNLKIKDSVPYVSQRNPTPADVARLRGTAEYELPNASIHTFEGKLELQDDSAGSLSLAENNVLLRGCTLRNTQWALGLVVFTGADTKVMKKASGARYKMSRIEAMVNKCVYVIFTTMAVLCTISTILERVWANANENDVPYLELDDSELVVPKWFSSFLTFLVLYNNFIPISLYVTIEMVNFAQALFVDKDLDMYDPESDTPAKARTSNLNQDLGQVEYIFSDKTGTLTRNVMEFKMCTIGAAKFGRLDNQTETGKIRHVDTPLSAKARRAASPVGAAAGAAARAETKSSASDAEGASHQSTPGLSCFHAPELTRALIGQAKLSTVGLTRQQADEFFLCIALCHTIVPEVQEDGNVLYQAESPDEGALVEAAKHLGYEFVSRTNTSLTLKRLGTAVTYKLLGIHKFNATRKRMSVVVQDPEGHHWLYMKGADNVMFERSTPGPNDAAINRHLLDYAKLGLRTLVLARRSMSPAEVANWTDRFHQASVSVTDRKRMLSDVAESVEQSCTIVGATAIEDKLQLGVPDAIHDLALAGIKLWVLTGDKVETAINIGYSCRLLTDQMDLIHLTQSDRDTLRAYLAALVSAVGNAVVRRRGSHFSFRVLRDNFRPKSQGSNSASDTSGVEVITKTGTSASGTASGIRGVRSVTVARAGSGTKPRSPASWSHSPSPSPSPSLSAPRSPPTLSATAAAAAAGAAAGTGVSDSSAQPLNPSSGPSYNSMPLAGVTGGTLPRLRMNSSTGVSSALIVTGESLRHILGFPKLEQSFLRVAMQCKSVVACRVSPRQKADLVALVRHQVPGKPVTLAIGDGANDVGMIQQAEVGVGISGKEGLQAVNASDFAIAQFRFLKPLLLLHGRYSYRRMAKVFLYSFYKNVVLTIVLFFYNFYTGWSGTSLYEALVYTGFNFFLGLPIVGVGLFDTDLSKETVLAHPAVYISGRRNLNLNVFKMIEWILHGLVHATLVFWIPFGALSAQGGAVISGDGDVDGKQVVGLLIYSVLVFCMQLRVSLETYTWNLVSVVFMVLSVVGYLLFITGYNYLYNASPEFYFVSNVMLSRPMFWFTLFVCMAAFWLLDVTIEHIRLMFLYTPIDIAMQIDRGLGDPTQIDWHDGTFEKQRQASFGSTPSASAAAAAAGAGTGGGSGHSPSLIPYVPPNGKGREK